MRCRTQLAADTIDDWHRAGCKWLAAAMAQPDTQGAAARAAIATACFAAEQAVMARAQVEAQG